MSSARSGLHSRDFKLFWAGQTFGLFGSQVALLALPLTAVLVLDASAFDVGVLHALEFAPFIVLSIFIGRWLDGRRRKGIMVASSFLRAALVALVPVAAASSLLTIELLWIVALIVGITTVVFQLAYQAYLPCLVSRAGLLPANSRLEASNSLAQIAGPGLGGSLIGAMGAPFALTVTAVSNAAAGLLISLIRAPEPFREPAEKRGAFDDLRFVISNAHIRSMATEGAAFNLLYQGNLTLLIVHATRTLDLTPSMIGLVLAGASAGGIAGSLSATPLAQRLALGRAMTLGCACACIGPLGVLFAAPGSGAAAVVMAAQFVSGFGLGSSNIHFTSLRQAVTPQERLGGMQGAYRFLTWGPIPLGALTAGALADAFGSWYALALMGAPLSCVWLLLRFSPVHGLTHIPSLPDAVAV